MSFVSGQLYRTFVSSITENGGETETNGSD